MLINLNKCLKDNDEILDEKNSKGHKGFNLMKYGVISNNLYYICCFNINIEEI